MAFMLFYTLLADHNAHHESSSVMTLKIRPVASALRPVAVAPLPRVTLTTPLCDRVVEDRSIMSAKYLLPVIFGQN